VRDEVLELGVVCPLTELVDGHVDPDRLRVTDVAALGELGPGTGVRRRLAGRRNEPPHAEDQRDGEDHHADERRQDHHQQYLLF
jgi:hypothetical protein